MRSILPAWVALAAGVAFIAPAGAAVINTGFEEGSYAATGLTGFSSITTPSLTAGAGTGGSTALDYGSDGASAGATRAIDAQMSFSMFGKYNGNAGTSAGTLTFGWTQASSTFNPFSGTGTTTATTDTVVVGVGRDAGNTFRLGAANGADGAIGSGNLFGTSAASLITGDWYRLQATVLFNSTTKVFTFNNVSLDDFGTAGTTDVTPNVLSGTGATVTASTFGTTARPVFLTNRDRGFQVTDNYFADPVPEPASLGLLAIGAGGLLIRRRNKI